MDIRTRSPAPASLRQRSLQQPTRLSTRGASWKRCWGGSMTRGCSACCCPARPVATRRSLRAGINELTRYDASIAWNAFVANSSALIAAYLEPAVSYAIFTDPRSSRCSAVAVA